MSTLKRSVTGAMLGAAVSASYAGIGASAQERVGVPVAIGLLVALALDEERDVGLGIVVGSVATSSSNRRRCNQRTGYTMYLGSSLNLPADLCASTDATIRSASRSNPISAHIFWASALPTRRGYACQNLSNPGVGP